MDNLELKSLLESLLFTSTEPLTLDHFQSVAADISKDDLAAALRELAADYEQRQSGIVLREIASGYQLYSNPRWHAQITSLFSKPLIIKLSRSALETLAIV